MAAKESPHRRKREPESNVISAQESYKNPLKDAFQGTLVEEGGFEPPKRNATDLQSAPFGHSGTPPYSLKHQGKSWSWWTDSNPRPADYKEVEWRPIPDV